MFEDEKIIWSVLVASIAIALATLVLCLKSISGQNFSSGKPESVNYHFTRQCNYECGFCFHTAKTSFVLPIGEAKRGLQMLKDAGILH